MCCLVINLGQQVSRPGDSIVSVQYLWRMCWSFSCDRSVPYTVKPALDGTWVEGTFSGKLQVWRMLWSKHCKTVIHEWEPSHAEMESEDKNITGNIFHIFDSLRNCTWSLCVPFWYRVTKKMGTFEKPNKNWRNPKKKIYWQKLNHYNLPFKRQ